MQLLTKHMQQYGIEYKKGFLKMGIEEQAKNSGFREIDPADYFNHGAAREAVKTARIHARPAVAGEEIVTVMEDGFTETRNVAGAGDMIVKNPGGEEYIVSGEKFANKYVASEVPGVFKPAGGPVKMMVLDEAVEFTAPWGETMRIREGGALVYGGPKDIYGIQPDELKSTYSFTDDAVDAARASRAGLSAAEQGDDVLKGAARAAKIGAGEAEAALTGLKAAGVLGTKLVKALPAIGGGVALAVGLYALSKCERAHAEGRLSDDQLAVVQGAVAPYALSQAGGILLGVASEEATDAILAKAGIPEDLRFGTIRQALTGFLQVERPISDEARKLFDAMPGNGSQHFADTTLQSLNEQKARVIELAARTMDEEDPELLSELLENKDAAIDEFLRRADSYLLTKGMSLEKAMGSIKEANTETSQTLEGLRGSEVAVRQEQTLSVVAGP